MSTSTRFARRRPGQVRARGGQFLGAMRPQIFFGDTAEIRGEEFPVSVVSARSSARAQLSFR
jgi:hypothetical protein